MGIAEELIPVIMALIFFVIQAYTGYKKEKEKAAKRQLGKPTAQTTSEPKPQPPAQQASVNPEPVYTDYSDYSEPIDYQKKPYKTEVPPSLLDEYRKLGEYAEMEKLKAEKKEVLKSQGYGRSKPPQLVQLETEELDDLNLQDYELDFDVREAVLAKAILDRPYS